MAGSLPSALTVVASAFTAGSVFSSTTAASILPQSQSPTAIYTFSSGFTYAGQRFHAIASGTALFPSGHTDYSVNLYVLLGGSVKIGSINLYSNNVVAAPANYTNVTAFQGIQQIAINLPASTASPLSWIYEMWGTTIVSSATVGVLGWSAKLTTGMYLSPERLLLAPSQFTTVVSGQSTSPYNNTASQTFDLWAAFSPSLVAGASIQLQDYELDTTV